MTTLEIAKGNLINQIQTATGCQFYVASDLAEQIIDLVALLITAAAKKEGER